jgi:hypothetical protein
MKPLKIINKQQRKKKILQVLIQLEIFDTCKELTKQNETLRLTKLNMNSSQMFAFERLGRDYLKLAEYQQNEEKLEKYWQKAVNLLEEAIKMDPDSEACVLIFLHFST